MLIPVLSLAQNKKAALEAQKKRLQQEIVQINALIKTSTKKRANVLTQVETVQLKMDRQDALIRLTNICNILPRRQIKCGQGVGGMIRIVR